MEGMVRDVVRGMMRGSAAWEHIFLEPPPPICVTTNFVSRSGLIGNRYPSDILKQEDFGDVILSR